MKNELKIVEKPTGINQKNIDIYIKYLQSCSIKSLDTMSTTYKTYTDNMKLFFKFLGNRYILSADTQKKFTEVWEQYAIHCFERGNNKRTLANKRTACSTFFDWCLKRRLIKVNPFIYIDEIKINENDTKKFDIQDRLIFNLLLDSGARISEIYNLKTEQLDLDEMLFSNVRLKEGYIDSLIFFEETKSLIKKWFEERREKNIESKYLFVTYYNKNYNQMSKETIRSRVKKIGKIVGIDKFYPHSIRKSILNITGEQNEGIAAALGHHKDTKVTRQHYMRKKKLSEMRATLLQIRSLAGL